METIELEIITQNGIEEFVCVILDSDKMTKLNLYQENELVYTISSPSVIGCLYNCAAKIKKIGKPLSMGDNPFGIMLQGYIRLIEEREFMDLIQHKKAS